MTPSGPLSAKVLVFLGLMAFSVFLLFLFGRIMSPFIKPLLTSAMLAVLVHPLYRAALRISRNSPNASALAVTLAVAILVLGPGIYGVSRLVGEASEAYQGVQSWVAENPLGDVGTALRDLPISEIAQTIGLDAASAMEIEVRLQNLAKDAVTPVFSAITGWFTDLAKNALLAAVSLLLVLVSLFFFLKEGGPWVRRTVEAMPLSVGVKNLMLERFTSTVRAVVHGLFLSAAAQGLLMGLGLWAFGVPVPFLLGIVAFFAALIPMVGPAFVWIPAALWLFFAQDRTYAACGLALYGALPVGLVDNFIKPLVIGGKTRMPAFFLFLTILGGIKAFGPIGLFLGPVVLSLVMALAQVFKGIISADSNPKPLGPGKT